MSQIKNYHKDAHLKTNKSDLIIYSYWKKLDSHEGNACVFCFPKCYELIVLVSNVASLEVWSESAFKVEIWISEEGVDWIKAILPTFPCIEIWTAVFFTDDKMSYASYVHNTSK